MTSDADLQVRIIYSGGYVPDLGIVTGRYRGWLVYRHPNGQWVTLVDLKDHSELIEQVRDGE